MVLISENNLKGERLNSPIISIAETQLICLRMLKKKLVSKFFPSGIYFFMN